MSFLGICKIFLSFCLKKILRVFLMKKSNEKITVDSRYKTPRRGRLKCVLYQEVSFIEGKLKDLLIIGAKNPASYIGSRLYVENSQKLQKIQS
jgi:hypothetical protein